MYIHVSVDFHAKGKRSLDFSTPSNVKKAKIQEDDPLIDEDLPDLNDTFNSSLARPLDSSIIDDGKEPDSIAVNVTELPGDNKPSLVSTAKQALRTETKVSSIRTPAARVLSSMPRTSAFMRVTGTDGERAYMKLHEDKMSDLSVILKFYIRYRCALIQCDTQEPNELTSCSY